MFWWKGWWLDRIANIWLCYTPFDVLHPVPSLVLSHCFNHSKPFNNIDYDPPAPLKVNNYQCRFTHTHTPAHPPAHPPAHAHPLAHPPAHLKPYCLQSSHQLLKYSSPLIRNAERGRPPIYFPILQWREQKGAESAEISRNIKPKSQKSIWPSHGRSKWHTISGDNGVQWLIAQVTLTDCIKTPPTWQTAPTSLLSLSSLHFCGILIYIYIRVICQGWG